MSDDNNAPGLVDGDLWAEFCDHLKRIGEHVQKRPTPDSPLDHAEGYRYISRVLRSALDIFVEHNDPRFPVIYRPCDEMIKYGGDNPDNWYQKCALDGRLEYRIWGKRNSVHYLSFLTQGSDYSEDGTMRPTGFLDDKGITLDADGDFEIIASAEKKSGNWLPMTEGSKALLIRQTFARREQEQVAEIHIERLGADGESPQPLDAERFAAGLRSAGAFLDATVGMFCDWSERYRGHVNQLPKEDQEMCQRVGGDPNICYYNSYWELEPDQALVVEIPRVPECDHWNLQLCNYWMESLDYRYHRIHVNKFTAEYEDDGSVRIVIAHRDPGQPNWLDTAGHACGTMLFRWIGAEEHIDPATRVIELKK